MIYVEIPHVDDSDVDLFKFATLEDTIKYLAMNNEESFAIYTEDVRGYEPEEYTLIEITK